MALLFMDGFDHYALADVAKKWDVITDSGSCTIGSTPSRWGTGQGFRAAGGPTVRPALQKLLSPALTTIIVGFAFKITALPSATMPILTFSDGTITTFQDEVRINTSGQIVLTRNTSTTLATSGGSLTVGNWYYLEAKLVINGSTGSLEVWINGASFVSVSGANTKATANSTADRIVIGAVPASGSGSSGTFDFDDLYLCDTNAGLCSGGSPLGDRRVYTLVPSGAGTNTNWTPSTGSNYAAVDDATANGDTDYVSSSTVNQVDTYAFGDLPAGTASVDAVQFNLWARKDDAGTRQIAPYQRNGGGSEAAGTTSANLGTSYTDVRSVAENGLVSGTTWGVSEINGSEFGVKVIA